MPKDHQDLEVQVATLSKSLADLQTQQAAAQRNARTQKWALGIGLLFVGTFALGQAVTNAFNFGSSNNVPSKFAYEGTLVIDGAKVTGSYDMKFTVVDASGTEYDFEITSVAVSDGKFAVEIGPLSQAQFDGGDGDDILLKIAVKQNGSYVPLGNGQTLTSVPFAAKASKAVGADAFEANSIKVGNITHAHVPVGTIVAFWGTAAPSGWLVCDGQTDLTTDSKYDGLKALVGNMVPDLRGRFLRGLDDRAANDGSKVDPDAPRTLGALQQDEFKEHSHNLTVKGISATESDTRGHGAIAWGMQAPSASLSDIKGNRSAGSDNAGAIWDSGGAETRPTNIAVSYIIKY